MPIVEIVSFTSGQLDHHDGYGSQQANGQSGSGQRRQRAYHEQKYLSDLERRSSPHEYEYLRISQCFRSFLTYRSALGGWCSVYVCIQLEAQ